MHRLSAALSASVQPVHLHSQITPTIMHSLRILHRSSVERYTCLLAIGSRVPRLSLPGSLAGTSPRATKIASNWPTNNSRHLIRAFRRGRRLAGCPSLTKRIRAGRMREQAPSDFSGVQVTNDRRTCGCISPWIFAAGLLKEMNLLRRFMRGISILRRWLISQRANLRAPRAPRIASSMHRRNSCATQRNWRPQGNALVAPTVSILSHSCSALSTG